MISGPLIHRWIGQCGSGLGPQAAKQPGRHFSQADHAPDAAASGSRVVLGQAVLAARNTSEGRPIMPFAKRLISHAHYRVLCSPGSETGPHMQAFLSWLDVDTAAQALCAAAVTSYR